MVSRTRMPGSLLRARAGWRVGAAVGVGLIGGSLILASATFGGAFSGINGKIVYTSKQGGNVDVYTVNADGSGQTRLTTDPANDEQPAFSADG